MTQRCIEVVIGRLVTDEDFRQTFVRDPRTALAELLERGTHLTHAEIAALVATGTGFLATHLFLSAQMGYTLRPPGLAYYGVLLAGLAACLGIVASTLPLLRRITGPETARNE